MRSCVAEEADLDLWVSHRGLISCSDREAEYEHLEKQQTVARGSSSIS
jgi:hypothetical protein